MPVDRPFQLLLAILIRDPFDKAPLGLSGVSVV